MPSYVVTGTNRGIGFEFVRQLSLESDNTIFATVRSKADATKLLELQTRTTNLHILEVDIVDYKGMKAVAAEVAKITGGKLDYLINNAAFVDSERPALTLDGYADGEEELLELDLRKSFDTNVIGTVHTINVFLPLIRAGVAERVITITTGAADVPFTVATDWAAAAPYAVSKAAVNMVIAKYAARFKDEALVFIALSPGLVDTSTRPPTPEQLPGLMAVFKAFQRVKPEWSGKLLTPAQSVTMMREVIGKLTVEDSGKFMSHNGNQDWL